MTLISDPLLGYHTLINGLLRAAVHTESLSASIQVKNCLVELKYKNVIIVNMLIIVLTLCMLPIAVQSSM